LYTLATHDFLTWLQVEGASPETIQAYRGDLRQFGATLAQVGISNISQIDSAVVRRFLLDLKSRGLSNATLARRLNCLRSFFGYCVDEGYLDRNPAARVPTPKREKRQPRYLASAEVRHLLMAARRHSFQDYLVVAVLSLTGIRRSELLALRWSDIDFEALAMRVHGKGNKERTVPIHPKLSRDLWSLLNSRLPLHSHDEPVFLTRQHTPISRESLKRLVDRTAAAAGLEKHITPHIFRHTFATRLVAGQTNLAVVRDLMGHADVATTDIYVHASDGTKRAAVSSLGGIMLGSTNRCSSNLTGKKCLKFRRWGNTPEQEVKRDAE